MIKVENKNMFSIGQELFKMKNNFEKENDLREKLILMLEACRYLDNDVITSTGFANFSDKKKKDFISYCYANSFFNENNSDSINTVTDIYNVLNKSTILFKNVIDYHNNNYIKDIKFDKDIKINNLTLTTQKIHGYELLQLGESIKNSDFSINSSFAMFDNELITPALQEGNMVWMSVNPADIYVLDNYIRNLKGHVLIFGLRLGYAAYMSLLKSDVKSVTVVEKNPSIIELFNNHILPQFKSDKKIEIINEDPHSFFLNMEQMNRYDTCFVQSWKNCNYGYESYSFFKENENNVTCKMQYFLDRTMKNLMREVFLNYLYEMAATNESFAEFSCYHTLFKKLNKYLYTKNIKINTGTDIFLKCMNDTVINEIYKQKLN